MAENLVVNGVTYNGVESVSFTNDEGEQVQYFRVETIPDYVVTEAESVIDRVIAAQGSRTFTLAAITDMHWGNSEYTEGTKNACQALQYIDDRIKLDAVGVLGDYTDGFTNSGYDNAISDFKAGNSKLSALRFAPNLRLQGNHDFHQKHSAVTSRYIQSYSEADVWGSRIGGYFYRDFTDFKLRIICLNTAEENETGLSCSTEQYNWFVNTLDLSDKDTPEDWQILILSHHPLDWFPGNNSGYLFWQIFKAYLNGTSWSNTAGTVTCDYTGKNSAKIIGNIHGHIHNLMVRDMAAGQPNTTEETIPVKRITTPESCYNRTNHYNGLWDYNPFGTDESYPKTPGTAENTAFCIYCINLDTKKINAICYGAGHDREISYGYTNMLLKAVEADGITPYNGGQGWKANTRLNSSGVESTSNATDIECTGFIKFIPGDVIRFENIDFKRTSERSGVCYFEQYDVNKTFLKQWIVSGFNDCVKKGWVIEDADTNIKQINTGDGIGDGQFQIHADARWFRISADEINGDSIITINEPIE